MGWPFYAELCREQNFCRVHEIKFESRNNEMAIDVQHYSIYIENNKEKVTPQMEFIRAAYIWPIFTKRTDVFTVSLEAARLDVKMSVLL